MMLNISISDIDTLPFVTLEQSHMLPHIPAVYIVHNINNIILYIGATSNLCKRWKIHHRYPILQTFEGVLIKWIECNLEEIHLIERDAINQLKPIMNRKRFTRIRKDTELKSIHYALRIPEELWLEVKQYANDENRSINSQIITVLQKAILESSEKDFKE